MSSHLSNICPEHGPFNPQNGCRECSDKVLGALGTFLFLDLIFTDAIELLLYGAPMLVYHEPIYFTNPHVNPGQGKDATSNFPDWDAMMRAFESDFRYCPHGLYDLENGCDECRLEAQVPAQPGTWDFAGKVTCSTHNVEYWSEDWCPQCEAEYDAEHRASEARKARKARREWRQAQNWKKIVEIQKKMDEVANKPEKERKSQKARKQEKKAKAKAKAAKSKAKQLAKLTS